MSDRDRRLRSMARGYGLQRLLSGFRNWTHQVTKLYHKGSAKPANALDADALLVTVEVFLGKCRNPAMLEYGEEMTRLAPGQYALELRAGRVWIEVSCETRSISRRILAIERHATGVLDCTVQRFGGKYGQLSFLDLDRPQSAHKALCGTRQSFTEQFRRMLSRQFPGWEICTLSCGMDLQRSFSPVFPRARLKRGNQQVAALACPDVQDENAMLTFALIWHHHVSAHGAQGTRTALCLFMPDTAGCLAANRLRWLTGKGFEARIFRFNAHGSAGEVDAHDLGNLQTRVSPVCRGYIERRFECFTHAAYCP